MEIGTAEPERADAGPPHAPIAGRTGPGAQFGVDIEGEVREVNFRVGTREIHRRWEQLVVKSVDGFEQPDGAGSTLEVSDVRFGRPQGNVADGQTQRFKHEGHALELGHVTHGGGGPMSLDVGRGGGRNTRILPGALDGALRAEGVGRSDALAFTIAATADATNHGVNFVAIALCIGQPLEQENDRALTHHKAVCPLGVGAGAIGAKRADFAEFDEGGSPHVALHPAGQHGIEPAGDQPLDGGLQRGER